MARTLPKSCTMSTRVQRGVFNLSLLADAILSILSVNKSQQNRATGGRVRWSQWRQIHKKRKTGGRRGARVV